MELTEDEFTLQSKRQRSSESEEIPILGNRIIKNTGIKHFGKGSSDSFKEEYSPNNGKGPGKLSCKKFQWN